MLDESNAAAFYCWQHKDQAENLAARPEQRTTLYPLKQRSSIDTLMDRVGVLNLDEEIQRPKKPRHRRRGSDEQQLTRRDTLPSGWNGMQGPLMSLPENVRRAQIHTRKDYEYRRSNVKASWSCCIRADDDDPPPPRPRPLKNNVQTQSSAYTSPAPMVVPNGHQQVRRQPVPSRQPEMTQHSSTTTNNHSSCQTTTLLSLIPTSLSPSTTSALLAELSRPFSPHDEAGYIYVFWLTPDSEASKPDDETASSLLHDDNHQASPTRQQRNSHAMQRYASVRKPAGPRTILLKIGRAANVHRRLSQWTKQCGQNITLIRYYPYSPSQQRQDQASPASTPPRQVPHVHRVERLVHLELAEKRAQKDVCEQCGREHREWFEVDASKKGLKAVDEIVRRWVRWAESADDGGNPTGATPSSNSNSGRIQQRRNEKLDKMARERLGTGVVTAVDGYY